MLFTAFSLTGMGSWQRISCQKTALQKWHEIVFRCFSFCCGAADFSTTEDVVNKPDIGINVGITPVDDVVNDVTKQHDDVVNDIVKFTDKEELAVKALVRDPRLSAARLADLIGVKQRQAQRIIASLKNKAGLKRRGAAKNGEWYFERGK